MKLFRNFLLGFIYIALLFLIFTAVMIATGKASTTQPRPNSLGVEQFYTNPNVYLFAVTACRGDACSILHDSKDRLYTNLKFQPYNTMELYEESVLFCGNVAEAFQDKRGPLVITYRRQATLNYKGVGCHDLVSVYEVPTPKEGRQ